MIESLFLSTVILIALGLAYTFYRVWVVLLIIGVVTVLLGPGSWAVFCTTVAVLTVACGCALWKVQMPYFWISATIAAFLPYMLAIPAIAANYREIRKLREDYPVQSLAARLAYEQAAPKMVPPARTGDLHQTTSAVEARLNREISPWHRDRRRRSLQSLFDVHAEFAADFVRADGFGSRRMPARVPARREYIELPEPEPIPVVPESEQDSAAIPDVTGMALRPDVEMASKADDQLSEFHADGVVDFVNPAGFGVADWRRDGIGGRDLTRVIGFQPHAFRQRPQLPERRGAMWKIEQLQLVSLLKHETPVAYESDNLPRMDELREARTRPLNEFEASALEQLRTGEELAVHETRDAIEMLGSLRAIHVCTDCHQVPQQTLLGAFSYRLRRPTPTPPTPPTRL